LGSVQLPLVAILRPSDFLHMAVLSAWCLIALLHTGCPILLPDPHVLVLQGGVAGQLAKGLEAVH
jgi:hypothetical protein